MRSEALTEEMTVFIFLNIFLKSFSGLHRHNKTLIQQTRDFFKINFCEWTDFAAELIVPFFEQYKKVKTLCVSAHICSPMDEQICMNI